MKQYIYTVLACFVMTIINSSAQVINNENITVGAGTFIVLNDMDFVNNGSFAPSNGSVKFTGISINSVSGTVTPQFNNMVLDKTGTGSIRLGTTASVDSLVQFNNGNLDLNGNILLLNATGSLSGEHGNSSITGSLGGYVQIASLLNAPSSGNPGNLGAVITSSQNLGNTIIRRGHQSQTNASGAGSSILRYYEIIPANNTALNATLRLHYLDKELNSHNENLLTIWRSPNTQNWTNLGFNSRDNTSNYIEQTAIGSFQRFTLANLGSALPVTWLFFTATLVNGQTQLKWATAQEFNNDHFDVQRSNDGVNFTTFSTVPGKGDNPGRTDYEAIDPAPYTGTTYYRLKQVDKDGQFKFSIIVSVRMDKNTILAIFPNPTDGHIQISFHSEIAKQSTIQLFDMNGRLIKQKVFAIQRGTNAISWNINEVASGTYILQSKDASIPATRIIRK
jgi:hypothetical protein